MTRTTLASWRRSAVAPFALVLALAAAIDVASAAEVTFVLRIENGRLPESMRRIRVKQNDVVRLEWRTDKPMNVHLHGYDIEKEIKPGAVTEMTFTARATGRFVVEPHIGKTQSGGHAHGDGLVTIEVYP
jgi:hypothetical protein